MNEWVPSTICLAHPTFFHVLFWSAWRNAHFASDWSVLRAFPYPALTHWPTSFLDNDADQWTVARENGEGGSGRKLARSMVLTGVVSISEICFFLFFFSLPSIGGWLTNHKGIWRFFSCLVLVFGGWLTNPKGVVGAKEGCSREGTFSSGRRKYRVSTAVLAETLESILVLLFVFYFLS